VTARNKVVSIDLSLVIVAMGVCYGVALAAVRVLSTRVIVATIVALHVILLMSPPLQLEDVFNYLGYARIGGLHGLNPYTHVIGQAAYDPIYKFTTWANLKSPYGPLFSAATYPLAWLPLPVAYWLVKVGAVLASLGFLALCWHCARLLGRDPRSVLVYVALNPIYLIYAVGGFHNDFYMIGAAMAAVVLALHGRDRAAGATLMVAVAIKFSAILILPFLLLAMPTGARRIRVVVGAVLATIPLAVLSVVLFGFSIPNLATQGSLLTALSIPNLFGDLVGAGGGAPWVLHAANVAVIAVVIWLVARHRDWVSGAGWASLALLASLGWLLPWYIVWVLPFAALGTSARLRRWTLVMSAFLVISFVPWTATFLAQHNVRLLNGPAGVASLKRQASLAK
jgi:alpha-1,6-mannosyltransferase